MPEYQIATPFGRFSDQSAAFCYSVFGCAYINLFYYNAIKIHILYDWSGEPRI